jgi:hypothetical protein
MRIILADLGLPQRGPTTLFEDNGTCQRRWLIRSSHLRACSTSVLVITGCVSRSFTTRLFALSTATHLIILPTASRSRSLDQLLPDSTVLYLVDLPLGILLLEALIAALDKVCFAPRSFRFCLIFEGLPLSLLLPQSTGGGVTRALPANGMTPNWAPEAP